MLRSIILLTASYLIGSIPFGFLVGRLVKKIDIREHGSGNIGATNIVRVLGKKWGILVFSLDIFKGFLGPLLTAIFIKASGLLIILSAILAVSGHIWPVFLKFKGGKGVATSLGAILALGFIFPQLWLALGLALLTWIALFYAFKYVSLASLSASLVFFVSTLVMDFPWEIRLLSLLLLIFILFRHKSNIHKLLQKKENRFK
tara:strand:- start:2874 stop:3479 length:606 start_codon:yes stop_codon:yes gene_type:complete